nr:hypothetical protein Iba_chr08bCG9780 [Ipomoea batatas]
MPRGRENATLEGTLLRRYRRPSKNHGYSLMLASHCRERKTEAKEENVKQGMVSAADALGTKKLLIAGVHYIYTQKKAFQKGKENAYVAASAKQKLDEFDDLISLGAKGKGKKAMKTLVTHITRSKMNPIHVTTSTSPVTAPVSIPKRLKFAVRGKSLSHKGQSSNSSKKPLLEMAVTSVDGAGVTINCDTTASISMLANQLSSSSPCVSAGSGSVEGGTIEDGAVEDGAVEEDAGSAASLLPCSRHRLELLLLVLPNRNHSLEVSFTSTTLKASAFAQPTFDKAIKKSSAKVSTEIVQSTNIESLMVVAASGSSSVIPSVTELHCFPTNYICDCAESSGSPIGSYMLTFLL